MFVMNKFGWVVSECLKLFFSHKISRQTVHIRLSPSGVGALFTVRDMRSTGKTVTMETLLFHGGGETSDG